VSALEAAASTLMRGTLLYAAPDAGNYILYIYI